MDSCVTVHKGPALGHDERTIVRGCVASSVSKVRSNRHEDRRYLATISRRHALTSEGCVNNAIGLSVCSTAAYLNGPL